MHETLLGMLNMDTLLIVAQETLKDDPEAFIRLCCACTFLDEALSAQKREARQFVAAERFSRLAIQPIAVSIDATHRMTLTIKHVLTRADMARLAHFARASLTLNVLHLENGGLCDAHARVLASALAITSSLSVLNLSCNSIGDDGAVALARTMTLRCSLKECSLNVNIIGNDGATALARAVASCRTLMKLDLSNNRVTDAGAVALADAVASNPSFAILDLGWNDIGEDGAAALADAIAFPDTALKTLVMPFRIWSCARLDNACRQTGVKLRHS